VSSIDELHDISVQLQALQVYVETTGQERGFGDESAQDKFMLLVEEVGELAKSMRPLHGVKVASDSVTSEIEDEIADVLLLTFSLANSLGIDMASAVIAKEEKNAQRTWN
jgi:NTP pyrophosphatase (non-canonical NTP hydrolase)